MSPFSSVSGFVPTKGQRVLFGRSHGEKTLGEVVKVNRTRASVKQLEARGVYRDYPVGTVWQVPFTLLSPAPVDAPAGEPVSPERAAMLAEIERLKRENEALRAPKRAEAVILSEIRSCYSGLSPENLWMDGEASASQARRRASALNRRLRELFRELGRRVSESEAFGLGRS
jgi:hypothetical protein